MAERELRLFAAGGRAWKELRALKDQFAARFLRPAREGAIVAARAVASPSPRSNVVGVGLGEKIVDGRPTGVRCVKFFVRVKYPLAHLASRDRLPKQADGFPVDVEQVGNFRKFARKAGSRKRADQSPDPRVRRRPAQPGCSVGFRAPGDEFTMAGTFGTLVRNSTGTFILSNNHVLADESRLALGSPIFQPGLLDGGSVSKDRIASLTKFIRLRSGRANRVDAAMAKLDRLSLATNNTLTIGPAKGTANAAIDMVVHKFGRTTGYTVGRVVSVDTDVSVEYDTGVYTFSDQIVIVGDHGSFSDAGDSGSLIVERPTGKAVGLLFAGSASHTIANHLASVLRSLRVKLVL